MSLVTNRFEGKGLYILDEPESALSPQRLMSLMVEINRLVKADAQFIIATHSPMIMAFPGACLLELTSEGIEEVDYWATAHFCVMREFLNAPEKVLGELFEA